MKATILLTVFLFASFCMVAESWSWPSLGRKLQSVGVRGALTCHGKPAIDVKVLLVEADLFSPDDVMAAGHTDDMGRFQLYGSETEFGSIEPKFTVHHNCGVESLKCERIVDTDIPREFITNGKTPQKFYDTRTIELSGRRPGETITC